MAGDHISIAYNVDVDDYKKFIESLRSELSCSKLRGIDVLMSQKDPLSWLDVHLTSGDSTIILKIDRRNLYLRGYSRDGGATFWEFSEGEPLISGSKPLAYTGSYVAGYTFMQAAGVIREFLPLGFDVLREAIADLATTEDPNSPENDALPKCARALLVLTQMIVESTRLKVVNEYIVSKWDDSAPLPPQLVNVQKSYGTFCVAILSDCSLDTKINASYVRPLLSIEYVRVNYTDAEYAGDFYGVVAVEDCFDLHMVYNRSPIEHESKGAGGGFATLTGPSTAIAGYDAFVIIIKFWDHGSMYPDRVIAGGDIVWEPRNENLTLANYNKRLEKVVEGEFGNVTVGYSVLKDALNATVKVSLINKDGASPKNVYGTIKASQVIGESSTSLPLFEKSSNDYVQVAGSVPLTRSVVVAPTDEELTIVVDLWDHDMLSPGVQGSLDFDAELGTQTKIISGECGEVEVSVTFD